MSEGSPLQYENNSMNKRITIDPKICHGQACIKDTRIPVYQILRMLANGDTIEDLLEEYPSLTREDILACFDYAASLAEKQRVGRNSEAYSAVCKRVRRCPMGA